MLAGVGAAGSAVGCWSLSVPVPGVPCRCPQPTALSGKPFKKTHQQVQVLVGACVFKRELVGKGSAVLWLPSPCLCIPVARQGLLLAPEG